VTLACSGSSPQTLAVGAVVPLGNVTGVCLGSATGGADYALIAFNSNPDSTLAVASFQVTGSGTTGLTTASVAPSASVVGSPASAMFANANVGALQAAFDAALRGSAA